MRYRVTNQQTNAVTYYDTAEEVIAGIPVTDEEERDFIFTLEGEGAGTEVHNEQGDTLSVNIVATVSPPGGEGGRRKNRRTKKQMRTRKGGRRHRLRTKTVKVMGKYMEAPRSRLVFQTEGGRRRRSHRRL